MPAHYTVLDHTADLGIIVQGDSLEAVFSCASQAMFALMGEPQQPDPKFAPIHIEADGDSLEDLLVNLLSELLAAFELEGQYLSALPRVVLTELGAGRWCAVLDGESQYVDRSIPQELIEIKAPTYHALAVRFPKPGLVAARVIFDL